MNNTNTQLIEKSPIIFDSGNHSGSGYWVVPEWSTATLPKTPKIFHTFHLSHPSPRDLDQSVPVEIDSTIPNDALGIRNADPFSFVDYLSNLSPETRRSRTSNRIASLIRAYQSESDDGAVPSLLSIKDFFCFFQVADGSLRSPSLTISAAGLLRAEWAQNRERVIVQFRGDEDVDYAVIVHHPKRRGQFERKSGRCSQNNLLENLSTQQQRLLFEE